MSSSTPPPMIELLLPLFTHTVTVPALRYRIEDIEVLVPFLLRELTSGADVRLAADGMRHLSKLPWPGNVAQLRRVITETVARQRSGVSVSTSCRPSVDRSRSEYSPRWRRLSETPSSAAWRTTPTTSCRRR